MRECRILIATGKRGVGKSVETIRMIDEYVAGNPTKGVPPRKALIFDVNDEFINIIRKKRVYSKQITFRATFIVMHRKMKFFLKVPCTLCLL